ncbi:hypothetical protein [Acetivibrio cellulolyticus]|uniref:hypothetical protein n=1 Tax=Acetivibrio cellulolyticus TaxID=35830 RepID=UPI0001E2C79F|nr:hypothetical protein [Acetivibrio cellulolyticus]
MFGFLKRHKNRLNKVELIHFIFNKIESIYSLSDYYQMETRPKTYNVNTVIRNVPVVVENGKVLARARYTGIPDGIVYFVFQLSNIQKNYVSSTNTIDVIINATIKSGKCTHYKFELVPMYERRVLPCT